MRNLLDDVLLKKKYISHLLLICFLFFGGLFLPGQGGCTDTDNKLDFTLPAPENAAHRTYLGLMKDTRFSLGQIKSDIVIIEIFSMYCPVCQREAPHVNTLFDLIQNNQAIEETVKLIGIGAGNSDFEVDFFKEKYTIEFPLFSDPDFSIHKRIGEVRTPHFFGLTLKGNGEYTIFYSQSGEVSDPEKFLETLLNHRGLKESP
jgi:peroxiredoxin